MDINDKVQAYQFDFVYNDFSQSFLVIQKVSNKAKINRNQAKEIVYNLAEIHVCSRDSKSSKTYCGKHVYYGVNIISNKSRKIYFTNYA